MSSPLLKQNQKFKERNPTCTKVQSTTKPNVKNPRNPTISRTTITVGFDERNKRKSGGILGEGGAVWKMAAASLHDDVLLDSEERHERAPPCAYAYDDSLVGSAASARGYGIAAQVSCWWDATGGRNGGAERTVWGTVLEMERFNNHAGKEDQGAIALVLDLAKAFERVSLQSCGHGRRISSSAGISCVCHAAVLNTGEGCSSKIARRNRSRPSRPFSLGQSEVACSCALCCRTL